MSKKAKNIIIAIIAVIIIGGTVGYSVYKSIINRIPVGTIGNTAGNLNNEGLFCEKDGLVFFANANDDGRLYSMKSDQTDIKKLSDLSAKYINAGGNYVFFLGENTDTSTGFGTILIKPGIYRITKEGTKNFTLTNEITGSMLLVDDNLYYQHYTNATGTTFAVIDANKRKNETLLSYMVNPASYFNGKFYYNGLLNDHFLHTYNIETQTDSVVWEGDIWNPVYDDGFIYYMDVRNDYRLCRYSLSSNTIEILAADRIDMFNLYGNTIYYQISSTKNPRLMRMTKNGSDVEEVASGVYNSINITSKYVYFKQYGEEYKMYCTPTQGAVNVREFKPGIS